MHYRMIAFLALGFVLASVAPAQEPSFTPFGQGCGGNVLALPSLDGANGSLPTIGDRFSVLLENLPFRTAGNPGSLMILLGSSSSQWMGFGLPLDLNRFGAPGCTWYASGQQVFAQSYGGDSALWTVDIQNDPSLLGVHFFNQGVVLDPGANPLGLVTTNAAEGVIGPNRGPEATIVFPPSHSLTHRNSILVRGRAHDRDGIAEVRVNGQLATTSDGYANWQFELPLSVGKTAIRIETRDRLGFLNREAARAEINSQAILTVPQAIAYDPMRLVAYVGTLGAIVAIDMNTGDRRILSDADHGIGSAFAFVRGLTLNGDQLLVFTSAPVPAVLAVDLATGNRQVVSGAGTGSGPTLEAGWGIAKHGSEALVVVQDFDQPTMREFGEIIGVNLAFGTRRVVLSGNGGVGNRLIAPFGIALDGGRLLVTDSRRSGIFTVDLMNGSLGLLSGGSTGTGPRINNPIGISIDGNRALVVERGINSIIGVDLSTGNRTLVSSPTRGNGPEFKDPWAITKAGTAALVTDLALEAVFSIDLASGDRAVLSDSRAGTGPPLLGGGSVSLDHGRLLDLDTASRGILQIDRDTGNRRVISDQMHGTGPNLISPTAFAVDRDKAYLVDRTLDAVIEVDLNTGDRRVISDDRIGSGPRFDWPTGIALDGTEALITDIRLGALLSVNLTTGDRRVISDASTGSGPPLSSADAGLVLDGNRAFIPDMRRLPFGAEPVILAVDLATGNRTVFSDNQTGTGSLFGHGSVATLTLDRDRLLLMRDAGVMAIDTLTGNRSIVVGIEPGSIYVGAGVLAVDDDQAILFGGGVGMLDLQTGAQVILSK